MYDAGSLVFNIRAAGTQVFTRETSQAEKAVDGLGKSSKTAADKTEELGKKQDKTTESTRRQAKAQQEAAAKARDLADAQEQVGKVLVTAGAAVVATTGLAVNSAIQWQSAWAGVTKTVDGLPEELAAVEDGLRGLTDVLPASHTEIAAVAEAAGQLGVKTQDVVGFTRTMIDLGETTNLSADQAATSLAQFMNIMGTAGGDVDRLGATIVALGNDGASTEAEIVSMAQRIAGSGKLVGATEGEVLALSNALASMGVTAELGGGVASRILQDLYSAVQTGGKQLDGFADVAGVSAQQFATAFENDPIRAMGAFATGLNGVEASGGNVIATLTQLGFKSTEEQRVLLQLKSSGDLLTDSLDLQNTAWNENTALTNEAAKRYDTVESKLGIMRNRVNDAAIDLGSVFLPVLADVAEGVGDAAAGFAALPAPLQEAIAVGGLLIGVIALTGGTALIAVPKVAAFRAALTELNVTGNRVRSTLGRAAGFMTSGWGVGIVAAAAAATLLQNHIEAITASSEEMENALRTAVDGASILDTAAPSGFTLLDGILADTKGQLDDLDQTLVDIDEYYNNIFARGPWNMTKNAGLAGPEDALKRIGVELAGLADSDLPAAQRGFQLVAAETNGSEESLRRLLDRMPEFEQALVDQATKLGVNVSEMSDAERAQALLTIAMEQSAEESKTAAQGYIEAAEGAAQLSQDLDQLLDLLNEANGVGQDAITMNLDYQDTLAEVDDAIRKAREGAEGYALSLDDSTQAGRDNQRLLVNLADDAMNAARAQYELDGNTDAFRQNLEASRQALLDRIADLGLSGEAAEALADQIMSIPSDTEWTMIAQTAQAQVEIDNFVNLNSGKTIGIWVNPQIQSMNDAFAGYLGTNGFKNADGNVVKYFAAGGVENHVAQIAKGGDVRVWAEDETQGESYIPHAASKRARSDQIMAETARILGGTYIPGGQQAPASVATATSSAPPQFQVIVSSKGDIDLLKYVDVRVEQTKSELSDALRG